MESVRYYGPVQQATTHIALATHSCINDASTRRLELLLRNPIVMLVVLNPCQMPLFFCKVRIVAMVYVGSLEHLELARIAFLLEGMIHSNDDDFFTTYVVQNLQ